MEFRRKIEAGDFVLLAEMEPPKGVDASGMIANAQRVKGRVDAFVVPEMSNAVMRMSSLGGAAILQNRGMETVVQLNCRDRNRIALQADLLAAWGCGISAAIAVPGEDPSYGDHHQARAVYDIDLVQLIQAVKGLNRGRDMAGVELSGAPDFLIGAATHAGAKGKSPELEADELYRRLEAGADFFVAPPIFDIAAMEPFRNRLGPEIKLLPTVLLLKSVGMARYIAQNMPSIALPDTVVHRIQRAPDKSAECVRIAAESVSALKKEGFSGALIATMGWEKRLPEIMEQVE